jgi:hypothetical protein
VRARRRYAPTSIKFFVRRLIPVSSCVDVSAAGPVAEQPHLVLGRQALLRRRPAARRGDPVRHHQLAAGFARQHNCRAAPCGISWRRGATIRNWSPLSVPQYVDLTGRIGDGALGLGMPQRCRCEHVVLHEIFNHQVHLGRRFKLVHVASADCLAVDDVREPLRHQMRRIEG